MARSLLFTLLAVASLAAPLASAHTTVTTADGAYFVTVGNQLEPVTTFTRTGLDLTIRANESGERGAGVTGLHLTLDATLLAPNGDELSMPLRAAFGNPGGYSFEEPYVLTQPGEYHLRLVGNINETDVNFQDGILVGSGPVPAVEDLFFPDDLDSPKQLEARIAALEAQIDEMGSHDDGETGDSPTFAGVATFTILGAVALLAVRRRKT